MDFELQPIITRDNVEIGVHPLLIFEIIDPIRAVYEVMTVMTMCFDHRSDSSFYLFRGPLCGRPTI